MKNYNILLLIILILPFCVSGNSLIIPEVVKTDTSIVSKREYKALQSKGDELFKEGNYMSARKKYLAMKAVPGFENDPAATEKEELTLACFELANQVTGLLAKGKAQEAQDLLGRLLAINPDDTKARTSFGELWYEEGMKSFKNGNYTEAKESFGRSLEYSPKSKSNMINLRINDCNTSIAKAEEEFVSASPQKDPPTTSSVKKPTVRQPATAKISSGNPILIPKIGLCVIAVGAGLYANSLRSNFNSQIAEVNSMARNTGSFQGYQDYDLAYRNAETYKEDKQGTMNLMVGIAAAAVIAEGVLFMTAGRNNRMVSFSPGLTSTVNLKFILK